MGRADLWGVPGKVVNAAPAINAAFLTGHTTLRLQVMGDDINRPANPAEIAEMRDLLTRCLEEGSLGLSTGLFYPPARAAPTDEVVQIARHLGNHGGIYVTHMRDEADNVIESVHESLEIGRQCGVAVVISHHKCMGRKNFGSSVETLALLETARQRQRVSWDVYPYTAGSSALLPELVQQSSRTIITWSESRPEACGRDLTDVAAGMRCTTAEAVERLQPAGAMYFMMDEADVTRIMCSSCASHDGSLGSAIRPD